VGTLRYFDTTAVEFDDRVLAHLSLVIVHKLRRQENFLLSWVDPRGAGSGVTSIWVHTGANLSFHLTTQVRHPIDQAWLEALVAATHTPRGLLLVDEKRQPVHPLRA
jgi:hypothetical protein